MSGYLNRSHFFYMHMLKCDKCRVEWLGLRDELPESRRNKALENVVEANHHSSSTIV